MDERSTRWARRFDWVVLVAATMVIPVVAIEQSNASETLREFAGIANWTIWTIFLTEIVAMLCIVPRRRAWLRAHPLDVAIVVLTPPFLPATLQALRVFRLLRLLRLLRALQAARHLFSPRGLQWAAWLALMTLFCGGSAFAAVEDGSNPNVNNTWDGLWWAVSTMTTVGYGDVYPVTDSGRMIAAVVMVIGIGFLSILIGSVAQRFTESEVRQTEEVVEAKVAHVGDDLQAELNHVGERLEEVVARLREVERRLGARERAS